MIKRRAFFKHFMSQLFIMQEEVQGNHHIRLNDIWKMQDDRFKLLKFRVKPGVAIQYNGNEISAILEDNGKKLLYKTGTGEEIIFQKMRKGLSVEEIVKHFNNSEHFNNIKYDQIREYFLSLIKLKICVPANPIENEEPIKK